MNAVSTNRQKKSTDWRNALAENQRKTIFVIGLFLLIYLMIGLLLDLYINGAFVPGQFDYVFANLINFRILPLATITMVIVAIISLLITYGLHDRIMLLGTEYKEITRSNAKTLQEQQLYNSVEEMKIAAGLHYIPKIFIIDAPYMNAFASGYSEKSAMIAVTQGLINKLNRSELQAVLAHELSHIRHGDIKLSLTAVVLSNIMLIVMDILFYNAIFGKNNRRTDNKFLTIIILIRYLLPVITILLMLFLSRTREYMADSGSIELMRDNNPLGHALLKIHQDHKNNFQTYQKTYGHTQHEDVRRDAYIFDPFQAGVHPIKSLNSILSTHPTLEQRLRAINFNLPLKTASQKELS